LTGLCGQAAADTARLELLANRGYLTHGSRADGDAGNP